MGEIRGALLSTWPLSGTLAAMTALSRLIDDRVRELGLSNRKVADLSETCPTGTISQGAVGQYRSGRHAAKPPDDTLRVLSWTLNIPLVKLQEAAGVPETLEEWAPPSEAHQLSRQDRDLITALIKRLVGLPVVNESGMTATLIDREDVTEDQVDESPTPGQEPANGQAST